MDSQGSAVRIAIPWLHIIREHPALNERYEDLYETKNRSKTVLISWVRIFRNFLSLSIVLLKAIFSGSAVQWSKMVERLTKCDILFVSHLLNESQYGYQDDFYYSNLPRTIAFNNYRTLTAMINHSRFSSSRYQFILEDNITKMVFSDTMNLGVELKNLLQLWKESRKIKRSASSEQNPFKKNFLLRAASEALSSRSMFAMRIATQVEEIIKKTKPGALIVTHEGHAWEKMAFYAARKVEPSIQCVGYTHAPFFENQHAAIRLLADAFNPDKIFTSSHNQKSQLENIGSLKGIPIEVLGSNRVQKKNTVKQSERKKKQNKTNLQSACLVIPEGAESESILLFDFSLKCAHKMPDIQFIWRLHPNLTFENIAANHKIFQSLPKNIELSKSSLEEDIEICKWVLYRGSSAVIQAVEAGLKPIYLHKRGGIKIDPLFQLKNWKEEVTTTQAFQQIVIYSKNEIKDCFIARDYCRKLYVPFDHKPIINLLKKISQNG